MSHVVFIQDDTKLAPNFWRILTALAIAHPDAVLGLTNPHPAARHFARTLKKPGYSTRDHFLGPNFAIPKSALADFLEWRSALSPHVIEIFGEERLIDLWGVDRGRAFFYTLPALVDAASQVAWDDGDVCGFTFDDLERPSFWESPPVSVGLYYVNAYYPANGWTREEPNEDRLTDVLRAGGTTPYLPFFTTPALESLCPGARLHALKLSIGVVPEGFWPCNPSVVAHAGALVGNVRCVDYQLPDVKPDPKTVNLFVRLSDDYEIQSVKTLADLDSAGRSAYGYEDVRLFSWGDRLAGCAAVLDAQARWSQVTLLELTSEGNVARARVEETRLERHEKNWMPAVSSGVLRWVYSVNPTVIRAPGQVSPLAQYPGPSSDALRGSSPLIACEEGCLAIVHESSPMWRPVKARAYRHRFVKFDADLRVTGVTPPFHFKRAGVEFCAGLTRHPRRPEKLVISFGVNDAEAWIAEVSEADVLRLFHAGAQ